jgi:hypothetical protein
MLVITHQLRETPVPGGNLHLLYVESTSAPVLCPEWLPEVTHVAQAGCVAGCELHPACTLQVTHHLLREVTQLWRQLIPVGGGGGADMAEACISTGKETRQGNGTS